MGGYTESAQIANIFEAIPRITGESIDRILEAQPQHVPVGRREFCSGYDEHAVVITPERLGVDGVVIGNHDELRTGRARRSNDVIGTSGPVRELRVDVNDSGHSYEAVVRCRAHDARRPPQRYVQCRGRESHERGRDRNLHAHK